MDMRGEKYGYANVARMIRVSSKRLGDGLYQTLLTDKKVERLLIP